MASDTRHDISARALFALYRLTLQAERHLRSPLEDAARAHELPLAEALLLLHCLDAKGGVSQRDLARDLSISPAQVSARLETLRQQGILDSARPASDRRKQFWTVTPRGLELARQLQRSIAAAEGALRQESQRRGIESDSCANSWHQRLAQALQQLDVSDREAA